MRSIVRLCVLFLPLAVAARAAAQAPFAGARSAALAGATVALRDDVRGEANPAAWGGVRHWTALATAGQLYGLSELRHAGAALLMPFRGGAAGLSAWTFGFELYRANTFDLGFGARAAVGTFREIAVGARWRWKVIRIPEYGSASAGSFSAGIHLPVTAFVTLGAAAQNIVVRGPLRHDVPRRLTVGASYRPDAAFSVTADVVKNVRSPASIASGVEISLVPALVLRAGVASSPSLVAGGAGIRLPPLEIDLAVLRHDALGWSPTFGLVLIL